MKKLLLGITVACTVSACVSPATEMINNNFINVELVPLEHTGYWTASVGAGLSTIRLNADGTGMMCEDTGVNTSVFKLRHSGGYLYVQNGAKLKVAQIDADLLNLKTNYSAFNVDMKYRGDNALSLATAKCAEQLK